MEIDLNKISLKLNNEVSKNEILEIYNKFKVIDDILKFDLELEEIIIKYFEYNLYIEKCTKEIEERKLEINNIRTKLLNLKNSKFNKLRKENKLINFLKNFNNKLLDYLFSVGCILSNEVSEIKLERFRRKRDENFTNYNELNIDGNVCVGSNIDNWK